MPFYWMYVCNLYKTQIIYEKIVMHMYVWNIYEIRMFLIEHVHKKNNMKNTNKIIIKYRCFDKTVLVNYNYG